MIREEHKFKSGDRCVIHSKTSTNNGVVVTVKNYTKGSCNDIIAVEKRNGQIFNIKESSLSIATRYDEIRNLKDKQLQRMLDSHRKVKWG
jgi:hypothetical protein